VSDQEASHVLSLAGSSGSALGCHLCCRRLSTCGLCLALVLVVWYWLHLAPNALAVTMLSTWLRTVSGLRPSSVIGKIPFCLQGLRVGLLLCLYGEQRVPNHLSHGAYCRSAYVARRRSRDLSHACRNHPEMQSSGNNLYAEELDALLCQSPLARLVHRS